MANRCKILMIEKKDEDTLIFKSFYSHLGGSNCLIEPALLVAKNLKLDFYDFYKMYEKAHDSDFYNEVKTSVVFNLDEVREEYKIGDNGVYIINKDYDLICKVDTNDLDEIIPNDMFINNMKKFIDSNKLNIDTESIKLPKREQTKLAKYVTNAILEKLVLTEPDLKKHIKSAILEKLENKSIPLECLNPISINNTKYDYKRIKKNSFFLDVFEPITDVKHTYIIYFDFMNIYDLLKKVS